jgi:hypothetical protein
VRKPTAQAPAHWSKDFVEHLRTVHFALIVISAGLILLVLSSRKYNAVNALVQIEEIIDIRKQWSPQWIQNHCAVTRLAAMRNDTSTMQVEPPNWEPDPNQIWGISGESVTTEMRMQNPYRVFALKLKFPKPNWVQANHTTPDWSPFEFPQTLTEFRSWWQTLQQTYTIYIPRGFKTCPRLSAAGKSHPSACILPPNPTGRHVDVDLELTNDRGFALAAIRDQPMLDSNDLWYWGDTKVDSVRIGVFPRILEVDECSIRQGTISRLYRNLSEGNFNTSFSDLSTAAENDFDLPLEDVKEFMRDEAAKGPEVFEAFGIKFRPENITLGGQILVLSIQLYFFIYLRQLSGKLRADDPGWDVPWIGMDTSRLGRIILLISLVLLPISAMALLDFQAVHGKQGLLFTGLSVWVQRSRYAALAVALIASICLGILSWLYRPKVKVEEPSNQSALFY